MASASTRSLNDIGTSIGAEEKPGAEPLGSKTSLLDDRKRRSSQRWDTSTCFSMDNRLHELHSSNSTATFGLFEPLWRAPYPTKGAAGDELKNAVLSFCSLKISNVPSPFSCLLLFKGSGTWQQLRMDIIQRGLTACRLCVHTPQSKHT